MLQKSSNPDHLVDRLWGSSSAALTQTIYITSSVTPSVTPSVSPGYPQRQGNPLHATT